MPQQKKRLSKRYEELKQSQQQPERELSLSELLLAIEPEAPELSLDELLSETQPEIQEPEKPPRFVNQILGRFDVPDVPDPGEAQRQEEFAVKQAEEDEKAQEQELEQAKTASLEQIAISNPELYDFYKSGLNDGLSHDAAMSLANAKLAAKPSKTDQGEGATLKSSVITGTANVVSGAYDMIRSAGEILYSAAAIPQNLAAKAFNIDALETSPEKVYRENPLVKKAIDTALPSEEVRKISEKHNAAQHFDDNIFGYIKKGDYSNAGKLLGYQVLEQLPQQVEVIGLSVLTGNPTIGVIALSGQAGGAKYQNLKGKDMPELVRIGNAVTTGLSEYITESYLGAVPMLRRIMRDGKEVVQRGIKEGLKLFFKETGRVKVEEALEEAIQQTSENIIDIVTENRDANGKLPGVFEGVPDASLIGGATGGLLGAGGGIVRVANIELQGRKQDEAIQALKDLPDYEDLKTQTEKEERDADRIRTAEEEIPPTGVKPEGREDEGGEDLEQPAPAKPSVPRVREKEKLTPEQDEIVKSAYFPSEDQWEKTPFELRDAYVGALEKADELEKEFAPEMDLLKKELSALKGGKKETIKARKEIRAQMEEIEKNYVPIRDAIDERATDESIKFWEEVVKKVKKDLNITDEDEITDIASDVTQFIGEEKTMSSEEFNTPLNELYEKYIGEVKEGLKAKEAKPKEPEKAPEEEKPDVVFAHFMENPDPGGPEIPMFTIVKEGETTTTVDAEQLKEKGYEVPEIPEQEKPPEKEIKKPAKPLEKWKEVGRNSEGEIVFEDQRGVRSVVDGNIRITEKVGIVPGGGITVSREQERYITTDEAEPIEKPPEKELEKPAVEYGSKNKLVTNERAEEVRKKLRDKLNQANVGIDPEFVSLGTEMAVYHIEAGAKKFSDFADKMVAEFGDQIRKYLKSFYMAAKHFPDHDNTGMDDEATIDKWLGKTKVLPEKLEPKTLEKEELPPAPSHLDVPKGITFTFPGSFSHTKTGEQLFAIQVDQRVSKEDFSTLKRRAKHYSGRWSRFKGGNAIPGFIFPSVEQAMAFMGPKKKTLEKPVEPGKQLEKRAKPAIVDDEYERISPDFYKTEPGGDLVKVKGERVAPGDLGMSSGDYFIYKNKGTWFVVDSLTGLSILHSEVSPSAALSASKKRLQDNLEKLDDVKRNAIERFGVSPAFKLKTEQKTTADVKKLKEEGREPVPDRPTTPEESVGGPKILSRPGDIERGDITETGRGEQPTLEQDREGADQDVSPAVLPDGRDLRTPELSSESVELEEQPAIEDAGEAVQGNRDNGVVSNSVGGNDPANDTSLVQNNYSLNDKPIIRLTKGQRKDINTAVREILENSTANAVLTEDQLNTLRQYTGEGGLTSGTKEALNQHFTDYDTIKAIYAALDNSGFKYSKALEPSVGSGSFVGMKPKLNWTTVDIDGTNHKVVSALYPKARHYHLSYEYYKDTGFDLVISNVPFLEIRGEASLKIRPDIKTLHDYYFASALDRVKENGIIAFITSKGTMDKLDSKIRSEVVGKADIIGAYRLPQGHFSQTAHTDVITDIIFMQRRPDHITPEQSRLKAQNDAFILSEKDESDLVLNTYYKQNPDNILGELKEGINKLYGGGPIYVVEGTADLSKISIDYKKYKTLAIKRTESSKEEIPENYKDFTAWAESKNINTKVDVVEYVQLENGDQHPIYTRADDFQVNIDISSSDVSVLDKTVDFTDVDGTGKVFKYLQGDIKNKIVALNSIRIDAENFQKTGKIAFAEKGIKAIGKYQEIYETHPAADKELKSLFKSIDENSHFIELSTLFDKDFNPTDVFTEQVRYTGSGVSEVDENSPLMQRAFASEDGKGSFTVGVQKSDDVSKYVNWSEVMELVENGYSITEYSNQKITLQNDILFYSGNIYDKLASQKKIFEDMGKSNPNRKHVESQLDRLESVKLEPSTIDDFDFKGSEPWIWPLIEERPSLRISRSLNQRTGMYEYNHYGSRAYSRYLNNNALVARIRYQDGTLEPMTQYMARLREAEQEVEDIKNGYRETFKEDPEFLEQVEFEYNRHFKSYVKPNYENAAYLIQDVLDEAAQSAITLRKEQIAWVVKAIYEGKGINAHDVGAGKTYAAITLGRALKKRGAAKKPIYVVPAKTIKKWKREILTIFPDSKVIDLGNLSKDKRTEKLFNVTNSNADYILISHEGWGQIKLNPADEIRAIDSVISEHIDDATLSGRQRGLMEERADKYRAAIRNSRRDRRITLDKLGVDAVIVDEGHNFKNIGIRGKLTKFGLGVGFGFNSVGEGRNEVVSMKSARSYDMRFKANYIAENNNGNNVFMLTATPTPNKPIEIYTMLRHLAPDVFSDYSLNTDQDFSDMFFELGTVENPATGAPKNVLTAIINGPELRQMMDRFIDFIPIHKLEHVKVPVENVVKHYLVRSDYYDLIAEDLERRRVSVPSRFQRQPGDDTVIAIYTGGRSGSIDPRLYAGEHAQIEIDERTFDADDDKIEYTLDLVEEVYSNNKEAGQLIFLDQSGHQQQARGKIPENLHKEMKQELLNRGFKETEVAIINGKEITNPETGKETGGGSSEQKDSRKQELSDLYNEGKIKVLIGTTQSMGEGMDLQVHTTDIYNVDLPYTPGALKQRAGRGVRFGNVNDSVNVHFIFMRGTFDGLSYDIIANKKGWNEALWEKDVARRISTAEEMAAGAVPQREQILMEMEPDLVIKERMKLAFQRDRLRRERSNTSALARVFTNKIQTVNQKILTLNSRKAVREQALADVKPDKKIKNEEKRAEKFEKKKISLQKSIDTVDRWIESSQEQLVGLLKQQDEARNMVQGITEEIEEFDRQFSNEEGEIVIPDNIQDQLREQMEEEQAERVERKARKAKKRELQKPSEEPGPELAVDVPGVLASQEWNEAAAEVLGKAVEGAKVQYLSDSEFIALLNKTPKYEKMNLQKAPQAMYAPVSGTVVINKDRAKQSAIFHEFTHPVMTHIKNTNKELYDEGIALIKDTDYETWANKRYKPKIAMNEALVQAIAEKGAKIQNRSQFMVWLGKVWSQAKIAFKKTFNIDLSLDDFTSNIAYAQRSGKTLARVGAEKTLEGPQFQEEPRVPEAEFRGMQQDAKGGEFPLFTILKKGHPKEKSTVTERTLIEEGIKVPEISQFLEEEPEPSDFVEENPLDLPTETAFQFVQRRVQDKSNRAGQIIRASEKLTGSQELDPTNFRQEIELYIGRASNIHEKMENYLTNKKDGFLKRLIDAGYSIDELGDYLYAKHAKERNEYIRENKDPENESGSGITDEEADLMLETFEDTDIDAFAKEVYDKILLPSLNMRLNSGLIDKSLYKQLRGMFDFYVPLKRDPEGKAFRIRGQGFSVRSRNLKAARGRHSLADNPFIRAVMDFQDVAILSEKNKVGTSFIRFIKDWPDSGMVKVGTATKTFPIRDEDGNIETWKTVPQGYVKDDQMSVWVDGKQKLVTIKDEPLLNAMKNLGVEKTIKSLNKIHQYLRGVITMFNLEFFITNFERDIQTALINLAAEDIKGIKRQVTKDIPKAMRGIWRGIRDKSSIEWMEHWEEFKADGAKTGWFDHMSMEEMVGKFEKKIKNYKNPNMGKRAITETLDFISDLNETVENAVRLATYVNAKKAGISGKRAAVIAKNLTINFNKKGEIGGLLNSVWLFSNAGIQGPAKLMLALKHKNVRRIGYGLVLFSIIQNLINRWIDDEEYRKISQYYKDTHHILMLPNGKHLKIKLPYGYNVFHVIGQVLADVVISVNNGDFTGRKAAKQSVRLLTSVADAFNPMGSSGSLIQFASPTITDPIVQILENKNFFGGPIRPDQPPYAPKRPESSLYFKSVNPATKIMTNWLHRVSGGGEREKGLIEISPENVDHVIDFAVGGAGRVVSGIAKTAYSLAQGKIPPIRDVPFVRKVYGESSEYADTKTVYEMLDESGRTIFSRKERQTFYNALDSAKAAGVMTDKVYKSNRTKFDNAQSKLGVKELERPTNVKFLR